VTPTPDYKALYERELAEGMLLRQTIVDLQNKLTAFQTELLTLIDKYK
jgi:hypothetical protein